MTKITIDGTEYDIPVMKFKTLKRAYPIVVGVQSAGDPLEMASGAIEVISMAMMQKHPDMTAEWIEENLTAPESKALPDVLMQLMVDAGLVTRGEATALAGEAPGVALTPPSTETSTDLSQSLLPLDVPEQTGTR